MRPTSSMVKAALLLCLLFSSVPANRYVWYWGQPFLIEKTVLDQEFNYLTKNNGAHAVAMSEYMVGDDTNAWVSIIVQSLRPEAFPTTCSLQAYDYEDMHYDNWQVMAESFPCHVSQSNEASEGCVSANSHHKLWTFSWEGQSRVKTKTYAPTLTQHTPGFIGDANRYRQLRRRLGLPCVLWFIGDANRYRQLRRRLGLPCGLGRSSRPVLSSMN
jgi:hypothetical protein